MKLRRTKKDRPRTLGRQRQQPDTSRHAAFAYRAQRSERAEDNGRQSLSLVDKRRHLLSLRFWAQRSGLLGVIVVALVCAVSIVSLSSKPRIVFLSSGAGDKAFHSADAYQQAANEYLGSSIWNRNKVTVDTGAASQALQKKYPELASVTITLPLIGHRPIYYLSANTPAFVVQSVNGQYVLDSSGKALLAKDAVSAKIAENLPLITDQTGLHVELGKQVIGAGDAQFMQVILKTLAAKQVNVSALILPASTIQELDVRVSGQTYVIKFNMHDGTTARQQAGTYLATANQLSQQKITPAQYIDVRVPGQGLLPVGSPHYSPLVVRLLFSNLR